MREFVRKQNQTQQANSIDLTRHWQVDPTEKQNPVHDLSPIAAPGFGRDFSRIPVQGKASFPIQPKLTVSTPGDMYEEEADRVADKVMRMPESRLQRTCACGSGCSSCQNKQGAHEHLQTKSAQTNHSGQTAVPPIVNEVLNSPGQPLDATTRAFMEPRFGHDFSSVRVHTDTQAAESATALRARAYTVGRHIAFGAKQFSPGTTAGQHLLAHELTHSVQQRASTHLGIHVGSQTQLPALQCQAVADDDPLLKSKKPTARAAILLQMFWSGVTNTGLSFAPSSEGDFDTASIDTDARVETIQAIKNAGSMTYTLITNKKTGAIHVREKEDGTDLVRYYQSGQPGKGVSSAASKRTSDTDDSGSSKKEVLDRVPPSSDEKPGAPVPTASTTRAIVGRTNRVSGGQIIDVYGTFPPSVEAALADGWLSALEMDVLWRSGKHMGCGNPGHDMMEMLTQRALSCVQRNSIENLSNSERYTWEGKNGVGSLGSLTLGDQLTKYDYIYMSDSRSFGVNRSLALAAGTSTHVFNMQRYLIEIDAETTLAPDDKTALRRLQYLHYVMQYPDANPLTTVRGIAGLPGPTAAQISQYKQLMKRSEPSLFLLNQLAVAMGLPN
jgi:hypothetical protein